MKSVIVALVVFISVVAFTWAANTKYSITYQGTCSGEIVSMTSDPKYGQCKTTGSASEIRTCEDTQETVKTWGFGNSNCNGEPVTTVNSTLTCSYKCADTTKPPFTGTFAKVERVDSCSSGVVQTNTFVSTTVCMPTTNNSTGSTKYGCNGDGDVVSHFFDDNGCKTYGVSTVLYTKVCGSGLFGDSTSRVAECNSASSAFVAVASVAVAVLAFFTF
mmetsp:Transcript_8759/g.32380  ORF Transcript_8759/g.32380 Transcript_8759/m.32380 type:complete len:217 (-) Transcript_8759:92-742(-)|eukprot:CAMPEP_0117450508 /NCGR_PEP_ID=MMETSP0759-20121206/8504_1 /TAXON_ID=63605 /ORGANISM="Percolomonas cosmopolitus, Strain WS" /LENGTH=216 /DNA_ID=CAMNT_0005243031 /DNA_START=718 /DNA_END=1368 /DNA_ORIENTATION=-